MASDFLNIRRIWVHLITGHGSLEIRTNGQQFSRASMPLSLRLKEGQSKRRRQERITDLRNCRFRLHRGSFRTGIRSRTAESDGQPMLTRTFKAAEGRFGLPSDGEG